jgi:tetratricopeptide (TPR) repeat protein
MKSVAALAAVLFLLPLTLQAQNPPAPHKTSPDARRKANLKSESAQADSLYLAGKLVEALPLYEDLCRQDPTNAVFAERHAGGLLAQQTTVTDPAQKDAIITEAIKELQRAESLGDTDPRVDDLLGSLAKTPAGLLMAEPTGGPPLTVGYTYLGSAQAQLLVKQAQTEFAHNDLPTAFQNYIAAAVADQNWYEAALLAGDATFRMGDIRDAGVWYSRAIRIDPDRETAYRYWGYALLRAADTTGARLKYELAIVAEPYYKSSFADLKQWADITRTSLVDPQVHRPDFTAPDGKLAIDPSLTTESGDGHASWLIYEQHRVAHGARTASQTTMDGSTLATGDFKFTPTGYVHTLAEEVDAITAMLADVQQKLASGVVTQEKLEPGLKSLLAFQKNNMLEPFILLNFNDAGIRYGYPEYRAAHRDQLVIYVDRYMIGPTINTPKP